MKSRQKTASLPSKRKGAGSRIVAALTEVRDALASGRPIESVLDVRDVEIALPSAYSGRQVRSLRATMGVSQPVFARLIGVSTELVQQWEQNLATPRPIAARLMDEISNDPADFLKRHISRAQRPKVA